MRVLAGARQGFVSAREVGDVIFRTVTCKFLFVGLVLQALGLCRCAI
jgi:hypothetical protein